MSSVLGFVLAALVTLASSAVLVTRWEKVGARLGFTQAILGLTTALAANAPEITSAVTALARGQRDVGVGVVLGSNVFNLAALLGLGALVAGRIDLHRRVILFVGSVSVWIALASVATATSLMPVGLALTLALVVFVPYVVLSAWPHLPRRLGVPKEPRTWLRLAIREEEAETVGAIHPSPGDWRDATWATAALVIVVLASVAMEHTASSMGVRLGWSNIVIGGVVLAGVTSLPNAVAAVYFAARGRASVVLSEALNSNNLNALLGFMVPAAIIGLHHSTSPDLVVAGFYLGLTVVALALTYLGRGVSRATGSILIVGYVVFVLVVAL